MDNNEVLKSIDSLVTAIDRKLEKVIEDRKTEKEQTLTEMKSFFEDLAEMVSTQYIGNLPVSLESLEKKIDLFDHDLKDFLIEFSNVLVKYENKLERRIKDEIQLLQSKIIEGLDKHQDKQLSKLDEITRAINNLSVAITGLRNTVNDFNSERFDPVLNRLEEILMQDNNSGKKGLLSRLFGR